MNRFSRTAEAGLESFFLFNLPFGIFIQTVAATMAIERQMEGDTYGP